MLKKIKQFVIGEDIQGFYLVRRAELRTTNAGKRYLDATLIDDSGEVNAKLWGAEEPVIQVFSEGEIVKVSAKVNEWNGQRQLSIKQYRPVAANDGVNIENFVPSAPQRGDIYFDLIREHIESMQNQDIKKLCLGIIVPHREDMMLYPAAKSNHHAIRGGLVYHIYRMLEVATKLANIYQNVNLDLLKAGIILHDFCKMEEMNLNSLGLVSEYSKRGNLLGHISMGVSLVAKKGEELHIDPEIVTLVQHMILAHHYFPEYGSPKKPLFIEAELLHHIDVIDAAVYDFDKAVGETKVGEFSEPVWSLDRRRVYNHGL